MKGLGLNNLLSPEAIAVFKTGAVAAGADFLADYGIDAVDQKGKLTARWRALIKMGAGVLIVQLTPRKYASVGNAAAIGLMTTGALSLIKEFAQPAAPPPAPAAGIGAYAASAVPMHPRSTVSGLGAYASSVLPQGASSRVSGTGRVGMARIGR